LVPYFDASPASVGQYAIQLAKLQGLKVLTTCSPKNNELVKSLGAEHVFSYRDEDVASQVKAAEPDLTYIFDTIGSLDSSATASDAINGQGKLCTVRPGKANTDKVAKNVEVSDVLVWTAFLKDHHYGDFHWPVRHQGVGMPANKTDTYVRLRKTIIS
jgi:NADPH:quinone reductase-like Zn-dependent oxidoreductase